MAGQGRVSNPPPRQRRDTGLFFKKFFGIIRFRYPLLGLDLPELKAYRKKLSNKGVKAMEKKTKVNFQGRMVDALEMDFKSKEEWNTYELSDGATLRLKPVATSIVKILDQYDGVGNPLYMVQSSNVMGVSAPEELKKGAGHPKVH